MFLLQLASLLLVAHAVEVPTEYKEFVNSAERLWNEYARTRQNRTIDYFAKMFRITPDRMIMSHGPVVRFALTGLTCKEGTPPRDVGTVQQLNHSAIAVWRGETEWRRLQYGRMIRDFDYQAVVNPNEIWGMYWESPQRVAAVSTSWYFIGKQSQKCEVRAFIQDVKNVALEFSKFDITCPDCIAVMQHYNGPE